MTTEQLGGKLGSALKNQLIKAKAQRINLKFTLRSALLAALCVLTPFFSVLASRIPFTYGLIGYMIFFEKSDSKLSLLCLIGAFFTSGINGLIIACAVLIITALSSFFLPQSISAAAKATTASLSVAVSLSLFNVFSSGGLLEWIYMGCDVLASFAFIFVCKAFSQSVFNLEKKDIYTDSDVVSICMVISVAAGALCSVSFWGINAGYVFFVFAIMAFSAYFAQREALIMAIIGGAALGILGICEYSVIATFVFVALISGLFKGFGSISMCVCASAAGVVGSLIGSNNALIDITIVSYCASGIMFLIFDRIFGQSIAKRTKQQESRPVVMSEALGEIINEEIDIQKRMMEVVARNITRVNDKEDENAVRNMCRAIASDVCTGCNMCSRCWSGEAEETYRCFSEVIRAYMADPSLSYEKLPSRFLSKCSRSYFMFKIMSYLSDSQKLKSAYEVKLNKFKQLISRQFEHINRVLDKLSAKLQNGLYIRGDEASLALARLQSAGVPAEKLVIIEDFDRKKKVFLKSSESISQQDITKTVPVVLSEVSETSIAYDYSLKRRNGENDFTYSYLEEAPHKLSVGIATACKHGYEYSGDNVSDTLVSSGRHLVAISDGMGCGEQACAQSGRVLNMLEELINSGCDETNCLDVINSILVLEDSGEIFSTLDVFLYDVNTSCAQFIKAGAGPSYLRKEENITKVDFQSLPVGILETMQIKKGVKQLEAGEYVYMMSDGYFECIGVDERRLIELIRRHCYRNPQKIADMLLSEAIHDAGGEAPDDVSVIVIKVR